MYKIKEFSELTNVSIKTLRYYDEINLFKPSYIDEFTNYRYYEDNQIKDIKYIIKLKSLGLSLNEIKDYINTNDMVILNKISSDLKVNIAAIDEFIEDKNNYSIKLENTYFDNHGLRKKNTYVGECISNNTAKYYVIYKNNLFYDDLVIYDKDNIILVHDNKLFDNKKLIKKVFDKIPNDKIVIYLHSIYDDRQLNNIYDVYPKTVILDDRIEVIK